MECKIQGAEGMIRNICRDELFLAKPSAPADMSDKEVMDDLADTLMAHQDECAGMAANMIGVPKRVIAISVPPVVILMANPVIIKKRGPYEAEEGCLSLAGKRRATRYEQIEVTFLDRSFKKQKQSFHGWVAQVIQHECDHLDGILI